MKLSFYILLGLVAIIFSSCSNFHFQVFESKPINKETYTDGEYFIFENDSIKLTYSFWGDKGLLSYSLENKLNKGIYVDWKSSSFIINGKKFDYWEDQIVSTSVTTGTSSSITSGTSYRIPYSYKGLSFTSSEFESFSNTISDKPEKITFIPPNSHIDKKNFLIYPYPYYDLTCNSTNTEIVSRSDNPRKKTKVYSANFEEKNSPLKFRNYLSISFSESSSPTLFVDNGFYVSKIFEVSKKHFLGRRHYQAYGNPTFDKPFKKKKNFYIEIEFKENNFDFRNNCN